jgi:hypothetical protein
VDGINSIFNCCIGELFREADAASDFMAVSFAASSGPSNLAYRRLKWVVRPIVGRQRAPMYGHSTPSRRSIPALSPGHCHFSDKKGSKMVGSALLARFSGM